MTSKHETEEKLTKMIDWKCERIEEEGSAVLSVCGAPNWDVMEWRYKEEIMSVFRKRGYRVTSQTNHGVLDIVITKPFGINDSEGEKYSECQCELCFEEI